MPVDRPGATAQEVRGSQPAEEGSRLRVVQRAGVAKTRASPRIAGPHGLGAHALTAAAPHTTVLTAMTLTQGLDIPAKPAGVDIVIVDQHLGSHRRSNPVGCRWR